MLDKIKNLFKKNQNKGLVVLSLFDGISCGQVALERAGIKVKKYYASEIDKYAMQITQKNYPNTIQLGDVRGVKSQNLENIDLLIGGSPCQSLSIVLQQTRNDFKGKSGLFFEYARLLKETAPRYFLLENVASMKDECKKVISDIIGVEPILINSNCFSAQDRPRYYWTNIPFDKNIKESKLCLKDVLEKEVAEKYYYSYPLLNVDLTKKVCAKMDYKNNEMHKRIYNPSFKCATLTTCGGGQYAKESLRQRASKKTYADRIRALTNLTRQLYARGGRYTPLYNLR